MRDSWDRRIRRAEQLAAIEDASGSLLAFYVRVLQHQKRIYQAFDVTRPTGRIDADVHLIAGTGSALLQSISADGSAPLATDARTLLAGGESAVETILRSHWHARSDRQFFPKALFQPYAQWLADAGISQMGDPADRLDNRCPRCAGAPQAAILQAPAGMAVDGGTRQLLCATCLTAWAFRRVVCPSCGEEDERKLGYFQSPFMPHVRIDACESCRRYLKTIDLGRLGLAVPLVDEVAAAPLDLWAREHGYEKIELNLVGL